MSDTPWSWFVALDGEDLDGLLGATGVMRFDWPSCELTYRFYDGISGGHNVSIAPDQRHIVIGNFSQSVVVIDARTLDVVARQSTMAIETCCSRLRSNTHHLWLDGQRFIGAVGDHLYQFDLADLAHPERLGPHGLHSPHELRWTHDRRRILMGDIGGERGGARQVGIFDLARRSSTTLPLPASVWHVVVHPEKNLGYAATYTTQPDGDDYVSWAPSYAREYIVEIDLDAEPPRILRHFSSPASFPIHLNSDLQHWSGADGERLYVASGASHTVVELDLGDLATTRVVQVTPSFGVRALQVRQWIRNAVGALARRSVITNGQSVLQTWLVTGWRTFDGVYATRVSPDGKYIIAGNRGYNYIRVMDRRTLATVYERNLPRLRGGFHLGLHHSELCPPPPRQ